MCHVVGEALCLTFGGVAVSKSALTFAADASLEAHAIPAKGQLSDDHAAAIKLSSASVQRQILNGVLTSAGNANSQTRGAAATWLVALLTYCTGSSVIAKRLDRAQAVFLQLLGDQLLQTQEMASKCGSTTLCVLW